MNQSTDVKYNSNNNDNNNDNYCYNFIDSNKSNFNFYDNGDNFK